MNSKENARNTNSTSNNENGYQTKIFLYSQPDNAVMYDTELCKTAYQLYNILVDMSNKKTHQVYVEVGTLAVRWGRSARTVQIHLATLTKLNIIVRTFCKSKKHPKENPADDMCPGSWVHIRQRD